jgi:hypothetical protein
MLIEKNMTALRIKIIEMDIYGDKFKGIITGMLLGDGYIGGGSQMHFFLCHIRENRKIT